MTTMKKKSLKTIDKLAGYKISWVRNNSCAYIYKAKYEARGTDNSK